MPTTDGLENLRDQVTLTAGLHTLGVSESPDGSGRPVQVRLNWVTPAAQQAGLAAAMTAARAAGAAVVLASTAAATRTSAAWGRACRMAWRAATSTPRP